MNLGSYRIEQLSEGIFEISGGGSIQKVRDHQKKQTRDDVLRVGLDPVLIDTGKERILLDAGLGMGLDNNEPEKETSNLLTNLEIFGYKATDINKVILSHLHYDHSAGLSYTDHSGHIQATLPNATIFVQKSEWEACLEYREKQASYGPGYEPDDLYKLVAENRFTFLTRDRIDIAPGITAIHTGGHTPGHQIVRIQSGSETAFYCGDLIPNELYMNHYLVDKADLDSLKTRKAKMLLLQQADRNNATLLFYHSIHKKAGKVVRDKNRRFILKNIT
ncbi:MBL fold metallo-hydrolase [Balneolaceae bacterium ANBcel3]|nr:MBL fold metallo-hydrolase [Balneolaceae bacterium ANBcel3]